MLIKKQVILAKIETTYNTDATPAAATDACLVENLNWSFTGQRMQEQPVVKPTLGTLKHLYGGALVQVTFDVAIKGSGTAGTAPELGKFLRMCGMGETVVSLTSVAYAPVSDGQESGTIYLYEDGALYKITGCRGTYSLNAPTGQAAKLSFTLTGHYAGWSDTALVSPTYQNTVPVPMLSAGFSAGGYAAVIQALTLDIGNQIATPDDINAADGYGEIEITGRDVTGSFNPEAVAKATKDFIADWQGGTEYAISTGVIGSTAGNQWQLSIAAAATRELSRGERAGKRIYENTFGAAEDAGDDEFTLTFT